MPKKSKRQLERDEQIYQLGTLVAGEFSLQEVLDKLAEAAVKIVGVKACSIRLLDEEAGDLKMRSTYGLSEEYRNKGVVSKNDPVIEAAFAGEIGDVVGPVETQFGFHLIEILDKDFRTNQAEYDQLIQSALTDLLNQYQQASEIEYAPNWQEMIPDQPNVISIFPDAPPSSSGDD